MGTLVWKSDDLSVLCFALRLSIAAMSKDSSVSVILISAPMFTSTKEVMFSLCLFVYLFVCLLATSRV